LKQQAQDQEYPVTSKLNWNNPLKGVSEHSETMSFHFISADGTRDAFDDSDCKGGKWVDRILTKSLQIRKVDTLFEKEFG
jgi:hypothetical protein